MSGFTFNKIHSDLSHDTIWTDNLTWEANEPWVKYNQRLIVKSVSRPLLPSRSKREIVIPGKHGVYDFGGGKSESRPITVLLQCKSTSKESLRIMARIIAVWLSTDNYAPLRFDDEPDKYYMAKVYQNVDFDVFMRTGKALVAFECQPYAFSYNQTWEDDLTWESELTWGNEEVYSFSNIDVPRSESIINNGTVEIDLSSQDGSQFDIEVSGYGTGIVLTLNENTFVFTSAISADPKDVIVINNVDATVTLNDANAMSSMSGEFLKLNPGLNTLDISAYDPEDDYNYKVTVRFNSLYK